MIKIKELNYQFLDNPYKPLERFLPMSLTRYGFIGFTKPT